MRRSIDALHEYLRDRLGDSLRSIVYYDGDDERVVYLRRDVKDEITPEQAKVLIDFLREREDLLELREELGLDAGLQCIVRCWEDHIGLHFPHGSESGTLVTLDSSVARDLHAFVSECESILSE